MTATTKKFVTVHGRRMAYVDEGAGERVFLLLHGNPTSSYLWRSVIPALRDLGRCLAPDLIGMGDSEKIPLAGTGTYRFDTHRDFISGFVDAVIGPERPATLVLHDWGSALGFDWANHHRERVTGIAYMEAIVCPLSWEQWPEQSRRVFQGLRSAAGEQMIIDKNFFVERILPASVLRTLAPEEMAEYRRPFEQPRDRWPTLEWPRQLPIDGTPTDVVEHVQAYTSWMAQNQIPKLFINADPGSILIGPQREYCRRWHNQTEITVKGLHFIQEDSGPEIGQAIAAWTS